MKGALYPWKWAAHMLIFPPHPFMSSLPSLIPGLLKAFVASGSVISCKLTSLAWPLCSETWESEAVHIAYPLHKLLLTFFCSEMLRWSSSPVSSRDLEANISWTRLPCQLRITLGTQSKDDLRPEISSTMAWLMPNIRSSFRLSQECSLLWRRHFQPSLE